MENFFMFTHFRFTVSGKFTHSAVNLNCVPSFDMTIHLCFTVSHKNTLTALKFMFASFVLL